MTGLVLEGSGHRGIYSAGVLDVLLENRIKVDGVIGVSSGTVHGASYISGQIGRSVRYTEKYCSNPSYMGLNSFFKTGNYFNEDFCYRRLPEFLDPFDNMSFEKSGIPFYITCTDIITGDPVYHKCDNLREEEMKWLQASASMPILSNIVKIDSYQLLEGEISDAIPLQASENLGFENNIVILTQPKGFQKKPIKWLSKVLAIKYKEYPELVNAMERIHEMYNSQLEYVEQQEHAERALVIRPSSFPPAGRLEKDSSKIRLTYEMGRRDAIEALNSIKFFINLNY